MIAVATSAVGKSRTHICRTAISEVCIVRECFVAASLCYHIPPKELHSLSVADDDFLCEI